ncbi:selenophosphate synthetase [Campylobacter sp. RM16704]|nr:selenophosphate synthetase [Campylobacter sp. RM16704]
MGLDKILGILKPHKNILSSIGNNEDASVYKLNENLALVQTLDFITPVVDSAYHFGAIAAANALSDVFAMGAEVINALNIVGFDTCHFGNEILLEVLEGARAKVEEAGAVLVGGHTIENDEFIFGLSVTGMVHPNKFITNNNAKDGDVILLTKPIGSGIISTAIKAKLMDKEKIIKACEQMSFLNVYASRVLREFKSLNALSDVTGFGLLGHLKEMLNKNIMIEVYKNEIPLMDGVLSMANMGIIPVGAYKNKDSLKSWVENLNENDKDIVFFDPQTSGGLLAAMSEKEANEAIKILKDKNIEAKIIARCVKNTHNYLLLR